LVHIVPTTACNICCNCPKRVRQEASAAYHLGHLDHLDDVDELEVEEVEGHLDLQGL